MKTLIRLVAVVAAGIIQSLSSFASDIGGITNIHVNAFVPFQDPAITRVHAGNASMWLAMAEGGLAQKIYQDRFARTPDGAYERTIEDVVTNSTPDAVFPTNTVMAHVWRGRGVALTNVYNVLSADVAKTIIDDEAVSLLTNFASVVKSVTRGVGSATIAYVDDAGETHLGKAVVLGCEPGDTTVYDAIVTEMKRFCQGREEKTSSGSIKYIVTNSTVSVLGSMTPVVVCGVSGRVVICTSKEIDALIQKAGSEYRKTGKKPYYDRLRENVALRDAELRKIDPNYTRNYKTEGFERFAYADFSSRYQPAVAKMLEQLGLDPALAATNKTFRYLATLCSEKPSIDNTRMRIDIQGTRETLRLLGATMRVNNLFLVNAGILDEDFMTFDEDWVFDPEVLAKVKGFSTMLREEMGLKGVDYWFEETNEWTTAFADVGYVPGKKFEQLFCAGTAGTAEENPCALCLPTNTVAGFVFQPEVSAWVDLNQRILSFLGVKDENLEKVLGAFKSHPDSFGKSASLGLVLGASNQTLGSLKVSNGMDFISTIRIENENLWTSIRILLEQLGCTTRRGEVHPSVTVCEFPDSTFRVAYDHDYKIVALASSREVSRAVWTALRDENARLVSSQNKVFDERMGFNGEPAPDHNVLYYFAPGTDTALLASLGDYLDTVGLGALTTLIKAENRSDLWFCGYGVKDGNGLFSAKSNISKSFWDKYHPFFKASCKTFGQIMAAAFPYDASKARVFVTADATLHVSRADNWDDVNGCLYPYDGDNVRLRIQLIGYDDWVGSGRLDADGRISFEQDKAYFRGYLTSEGFFGDYDVLAPGYCIGRLAPEIEPELSVLPSAEEIAAQLKQVVEAIGVESVTIGATVSDGKGPFGEPAAVRSATIVPTPGGGLDQLLYKEAYDANKSPVSFFMPSNTIFGTTFRFANGSLTNVLAALEHVQPELMAYIKKLFGGFGLTEEQLGATVKDGLALGLAKEVDGLKPYFVARLNRNQYQNWVALTNRLYEAEKRGEVKDVTFKSSTTPNIWEAIAFTRTDSDRTICYTRVLEIDGGRDPYFIITPGTFDSDVTRRVLRAGIRGKDRLRDDPTFQACEIEDEASELPTIRGFTYLAPLAGKYWFYDKYYYSMDDGELVIKRRTSAELSVKVGLTTRFFVNYLEALSGETIVTFEKDSLVDARIDAVVSNVVAKLRWMRTALGVTGLDFYDADPDEDGRYGNSELAIGTKGDGCEFLKRFAADAPASEHLVEQYIPATAAAMAKGNAEPGFLIDDVNTSMKALANLVGEKYPQIAATITNFLASDEWRISMESMRLTGTHKAVAVLQDLENPFVKPIGDDNYAGISAGYSVLSVFGPMESSLPFLLIKQAVAEKGNWKTFVTNDLEFLIHDGKFGKLDLSAYLRPTFMFDTRNNVMVFATSVKSAKAAAIAGRQGGENRLIDSATFADVMGFKQGEPMREHNTLVYFAPQNDDILGCTLRRVLSPYLPESYAMLLDRPSLKGYWGGAYGVRVKDAFRIYIHAGIKGHTAFLAAGQALLKTAAESMRVRQPYDWTEPKVFRSADTIRLIEWTGETNEYAVSTYTDEGKYLRTHLLGSDSYTFCEMSFAWVFGKECVFCSARNGISAYNAGRDAFHLHILDKEADTSEYTGGAGTDFYYREWTFPAGEKVEQKICLYPANVKVTKVTGLPRGLSIKQTKEGAFLTGTPTKVGEDCIVKGVATCLGRQDSPMIFRIVIANYASDYAELDAGYDLTAGVEDSLMLTNVIGWTASGVPSGMKFDKTTGALSGTPAKPGEYVVTFTTKIDGKTEKVSTVITVGQGEGIQIATGFSDKTSGLAKDGETRVIYAGVKIDWPVEVKGLEDVETTLSAKGLPSGLKLVKSKEDGSYSIQGIATKASAIDKKTDEVKPSTVVLTGTNKYKWTGAETFDLVVKALPDWAIGTFNGYNGTVQGDATASVKVTVSSAGKISVSINGVSSATGKPAADSFSLNGFDSYDAANHCFAFSHENVKMKSGIASRYSGAIDRDPNITGSQSEGGRYLGYFENFDEDEDLLYISWGGNYHWTKYVFPSGRDQLTLDLTDEVNPGLEGITLKFANGGKVTVAGTVVDPEDGKAVRVSASAALYFRSNEDIKGDGYFPTSVGFVVKTKTPFYARVLVWLKRIGESDTFTEVYEIGPTKGE